MKSSGIHIYKPRRKKDYDYNLPGAYFITICTKNRECLFSEIKNGTVVLKKTGDIAKKCLSELPSHHSNVELGEYVFMPNHVHVLLMIYESYDGGTQASLLRDTDKVFNHMSRRLSNLSVVVGSYKSAVTRKVNREIPHSGFAWQRYYHDHIVRDERGLVNVSDYIRSNPAKWEEDLENIKYLSSLANNEREKRIKNFYMNLSN
jgi:REP element-mobilizing transposase RayT